MIETPSLDAILIDGLDALLNPAKQRKQAARDLPLLAIQRIREGFIKDRRDYIVREFIKNIWDVLQEERGDAQGMGWDELMVGAAVALDILTGDDLPRRIEKTMQHGSIRDLWQTHRIKYQHFVLTVSHSVNLQRIFLLEDGTTFIDGPRFQGKSHTLMEELIIRKLLESFELPIAATGEFCIQDGRILPVSNLVEKAITWWTTKPGGVFISCVPTKEEIEQILEHFSNSMDRKHRADHLSADFKKTMGPWIMGASIQEIEYKLNQCGKKRTVSMWDGREHETSVLPKARFQVPSKENTTSYAVFEEVAREQHAAYDNLNEPTGLLLIGGPGSGKSIYSQVLENTFMVQTPSGQLGLGIRCTAKTLGCYLDNSLKDNVSWLEFFKHTGKHDDELLDALSRTHRLVPIIDGLDEVSPRVLEDIKHWLNRGCGLWIASSRPISRLEGLSNAKRLEFADLERDDAVELFSLIGKPHFAAWWREQSHYETTPIQTLGLTPLHLTMVAQAYDTPDDLPSVSDVYSRIFADWLDWATRKERFDEKIQDQLRSLLPSFIGEVALHWLCTESSHIERSLIDQQFEAVGIAHLNRGSLLNALASINLLLPDGDVYEFGHRTFAEYAAACALRARVPRHSTAERELEELSFALQDGLLHKSKWKTLLIFYAPYIQHPHALLKRFIGVESLRDPGTHFESVNKYEFGDLWSFAIELTSQCKSWSVDEAKATWATVLKLWLFTQTHQLHFKLTDLRPLGEALEQYLPKTLDEHIDLIEDEQQKTQLRNVGLGLLDAMPVIIHEDLKKQLLEKELGKKDALKIMDWLKRLECAPTDDDLETLLDRWAHDSDASEKLWALCLPDSPHLLDHRIMRKLKQENSSFSDVMGTWLVTPKPSDSYSSRGHYDYRRNVLELLLNRAEISWSLHEYIQQLSQEALDEIVGCLWEKTPPARRGDIEALIKQSKCIPNQCEVRDVISIYISDKNIHKHDDILSMVEWFRAHQEDLRTYVQEASGTHKFAAVLLLALIEQEVELEALAKHLQHADDEYSELAHKRIHTLSNADPSEPLPECVDMSKMSLLVRATQEFGPWKLELLEALTGKPDSTLLQLTAKKKIREALPILYESLKEELSQEERLWRYESDLLPCIATLISTEDTEFGRVAMRYALVLAWTYESKETSKHHSRDNQTNYATLAPLTSFLCLEDLELITRQDKAVKAGSFLAGVLQHQSKPAFDKLLKMYRQLKLTCEEDSEKPAFLASENLSTWEQKRRELEKKNRLNSETKKLNSLAETIINSLTTESMAFDEFVQLLCEVVPGDHHLIFSSHGSLGKDFDEPHDLNWHSDQQNKTLVEAAAHKLAQYRSDDKASLDTLRSLFCHPSETLRLVVFNHCIALAAPHEVASLANAAIAGHIRFNRTQWKGAVDMYRLSGMAGGAGQSYVYSPQTLNRLLEALESHITIHHWDEVIAPLFKEHDSQLRLLGVKLASIVGSARNSKSLQTLLMDEDARVMSAALSCLLQWQPESIPELLLKSQESWKSGHTYEALECFIQYKNPFSNPLKYIKSFHNRDLSARIKKLPPYDLEPVETLLKQLDPHTVISLLDSAAHKLVCVATSQRTVFDGFPSTADRFIEFYQDDFAHEVNLLRSWSKHPHPSVRDVGIRWLCIFDEFCEEHLHELSQGSTNADRLSCVEAIILTSHEPLHTWALEVIHAATQFNYVGGESSTCNDFLPEDTRTPYRNYWKRILWALQFSEHTFVDMLVPLSKYIHFDTNGLPDEESETILRRIKLLVQCWGEPCILPLLDLLDEGKVEHSVYYRISFPPLTSHTIEVLQNRAEADEQREFSRQLWEDLNSCDNVFDHRETLASALEKAVGY